MHVIANHMMGVRISPQLKSIYFNLLVLNLGLIGGMVDALVSKTNPNKGVGSSPTLGIRVWCNGNIVGLGPIDAGSSPATLKWDVAKSGKALDFGSNIHGFKSHRPNGNPALV